MVQMESSVIMINVIMTLPKSVSHVEEVPVEQLILLRHIHGLPEMLWW